MWVLWHGQIGVFTKFIVLTNRTSGRENSRTEYNASLGELLKWQIIVGCP
jgi:hypothetical protein